LLRTTQNLEEDRNTRRIKGNAVDFEFPDRKILIICENKPLIGIGIILTT